MRLGKSGDNSFVFYFLSLKDSLLLEVIFLSKRVLKMWLSLFMAGV